MRVALGRLTGCSRKTQVQLDCRLDILVCNVGLLKNQPFIDFSLRDRQGCRRRRRDAARRSLGQERRAGMASRNLLGKLDRCGADLRFGSESVWKMVEGDSLAGEFLIHALDVDRAKPWPDGQDRQDDEALPVLFDG
jgi:hypothetical protein